MNNHKRLYVRLIVAVTVSIQPSAARCQQEPHLRLDDCYRQARENYPLVKQQSLIRRSNEFSLANISKGNLPQLSIAGQASYQSDVTKLPVQLPGASIPVLDKDQYKLYGEVAQPLTDLITVRHQKELQEANNRSQEQNLEVELFKIRERVNQLFFGILLLDEQLRQNTITKKDIAAGINKVTAAIRNGTEFRSSLDKLSAEMLRAKQRDIELQSGRQAYVQMLGAFINKPLSDSVQLEKPNEPALNNRLDRPELKAFSLQKQVFDVQNKLIDTRALPKFSLFVQGGLGRPSPVNMLSRDLSGFYIGGLRLGWSLSNFYTLRKEKKLNAIGQDQLSVQEETFVFNIMQSLTQQKAEISRLNDLISTDMEIVRLRTSIKQAASAQLDNGVITVNDYVKEINAEDQARQTASLHQIQLLMAEYSYNTISGN